MAYSHPAVTLSVRVAPKILQKLNKLADATGRTKSFLTMEAIQYYLATQAWQVTSIKNAVKKADSKDAKFVDHQQVETWLNSWGNKDELDMPE